MVLIVFGPRTASFAKWLRGRGDEGLVLLRDHEVRPETLGESSLVYSYKGPSSLKSIGGSEGLTGKPKLVYQGWPSIRGELLGFRLKWTASDFCKWLGWASRLLVPLGSLEGAVDILCLQDFQEMMVLFPQKSCRKLVFGWIGKLFGSGGKTIVPLGLKEDLKEWQIILLN